MASTYIAVFLAGGLGSVCRFAFVSLAFRMYGATFPWGTLGVNVAGCFLVGLVGPLLISPWADEPYLRAMVIAGFLGGFTTFSAFSWETIALLQQNLWIGVLNIAANLILSLAATAVGFWLSRMG